MAITVLRTPSGDRKMASTAKSNAWEWIDYDCMSLTFDEYQADAYQDGTWVIWFMGEVVYDGKATNINQAMNSCERFLSKYTGYVASRHALHGKKSVRKRAGGWVSGKVDVFGAVYEYQAKVYDEGSIYGIGDGPVSKLHIKRESDPGWNREICSYERGWDIVPQDEDVDVFSAVMEKLDPNFWDYAFESFE